MKTGLVLGLFVVLAAGASVAWLHHEHVASMREMNARLDAISHEVSALQAERSAAKPVGSGATERKSVLQAVGSDRAERQREEHEERELFMEMSELYADQAARKYDFTPAQRAAFAEILRMGRDRLEMVEKLLAESQPPEGPDLTRCASAVRGLKVWRSEEFANRLGPELATRIGGDTEFGVLSDAARLERSRRPARSR
jgi:outer membrane murein-binding lipoprotein Lpp